MIYMLCRNRVADFSRWKAVFGSHEAAHRAAGLRLLSLRREIEEPNNVFFVFEVESIEKARKFISDPEAAKAAQGSGVTDGEYHFVEEAGGYR
ncbi:MAG: hypothetical protein WCC04_08005 [Terriglobales bacterium]